MQVEIQNKPMSRGVTQLMYVGDDDAVENSGVDASRKFQLAGAAMLAYAIFGPKKHRNAAIGASFLLAIFPYSWG